MKKANGIIAAATIASAFVMIACAGEDGSADTTALAGQEDSGASGPTGHDSGGSREGDNSGLPGQGTADATQGDMASGPMGASEVDAGGGPDAGSSGDAGQGDGGAGTVDASTGDGGGQSHTAAPDSCVAKMCGDPCTGCGMDACRCNRLAECERDDDSQLDCTQPAECPSSPPAADADCSGVSTTTECSYGECGEDPDAGRAFARCVGGAWEVVDVGCDGYACVGAYGTAYCERDELCYEYQGGSPQAPQCVSHSCGEGPVACDCISRCNPTSCTVDAPRITCSCGGAICG